MSLSLWDWNIRKQALPASQGQFFMIVLTRRYKHFINHRTTHLYTVRSIQHICTAGSITVQSVKATSRDWTLSLVISVVSLALMGSRRGELPDESTVSRASRRWWWDSAEYIWAHLKFRFEFRGRPRKRSVSSNLDWTHFVLRPFVSDRRGSSLCFQLRSPTQTSKLLPHPAPALHQEVMKRGEVYPGIQWR